jgi:hypothetical protein
MASSNRGDQSFWDRRYARSQAAVEQVSGPGGAAVDAARTSLLTARDGSKWRLSIVPPGEPVTGTPIFALLVWLGVFLFRGYFVPSSDNGRFVVVAARQRGPWRGFEHVVVDGFDDPAKAVERFKTLRSIIVDGDPTTLHRNAST